MSARRREAPRWVDVLLGLTYGLVVVALVGGAVLAYNRAFVPRSDVELRTDSVGNALQKGSDVKLHGVPVGEVAKISTAPDGAVLTLALKPDVLKRLSPDTTARLLPKTLFGERYVDLQSTSASAGDHLEAGATIHQDASSDAIELQKVLDELLDHRGTAGQLQDDRAVGVRRGVGLDEPDGQGCAGPGQRAQRRRGAEAPQLPPTPVGQLAQLEEDHVPTHAVVLGRRPGHAAALAEGVGGQVAQRSQAGEPEPVEHQLAEVGAAPGWARASRRRARQPPRESSERPIGGRPRTEVSAALRRSSGVDGVPEQLRTALSVGFTDAGEAGPHPL